MVSSHIFVIINNSPKVDSYSLDHAFSTELILLPPGQKFSLGGGRGDKSLTLFINKAQIYIHVYRISVELKCPGREGN